MRNAWNADAARIATASENACRESDTARIATASEHRERATRPERAGEAAREDACRGVGGAKPLGEKC